jgi:hypothetical protein
MYPGLIEVGTGHTSGSQEEHDHVKLVLAGLEDVVPTTAVKPK